MKVSAVIFTIIAAVAAQDTYTATGVGCEPHNDHWYVDTRLFLNFTDIQPGTAPPVLLSLPLPQLLKLPPTLSLLPQAACVSPIMTTGK
jgi:hypothetical protein